MIKNFGGNCGQNLSFGGPLYFKNMKNNLEHKNNHFLHFSSMGSSLSSMSAQSCLQQQRDAYPYMFHHDPLSQLASASYGRSCGATQSAQSHMGTYGSSITSSGGSQGGGKLNFINTFHY